ncbi:T-cell surface glycoprotein CD8 alpha chain [Eleutherodactylus coqui]|uniref:T-cell surface glycoprotein CD8 alpha chain n=1 Tax=Eleutherodactylus coqui TaxID=57060 RepID=UPI0034617F06
MSCAASQRELQRAVVSHTMLTITSLPILLCLFLCTHQLKLTSNPLQRGIRKTMTLSCQVESGEANDVGVFWFRHLKSATSPESIVYLSATKKPTYKDQKSGNDRFIPNASGSTFTLDIKEFDEKDQGTYYCLINKNSVLHISPGYQLIYTEVATPKPKSTKPPPAATTDPGDPCNCGPEQKDQPSLGLSCDIYVWAPLAGICGFFLICFLITFIMLCCRTRRRVCRCKPRPMDEKNGKMNKNIPNRHM